MVAPGLLFETDPSSPDPIKKLFLFLLQLLAELPLEFFIFSTIFSILSMQ